MLAVGALTTMWLSVSMAVTFGVYGLLRKTVAAGALAGLTVESLILCPVALAIVGWYCDDARRARRWRKAGAPRWRSRGAGR